MDVNWKNIEIHNFNCENNFFYCYCFHIVQMLYKVYYRCTEKWLRAVHVVGG